MTNGPVVRLESLVLITPAGFELQDAILGVFRTCYDPESSVDILELGLAYSATIDEEANVCVDMILTAPS